VQQHHGLLDIGVPKAGDTVYVSGAAGAVGSLVCQLAKIKGCKVIGSAGSDVKVEMLKKDYGCDGAFNYKTVNNFGEELERLAPNGIDVFFDNVGGETLDTVLTLMNTHGRIVVCGMISQYNGEVYHFKNLAEVLTKELKVEGFIILGHMTSPEFMGRFTKDIFGWIKEGKLKYASHITKGIENVPSAFVGLLKGKNVGKQVIKVADL